MSDLQKSRAILLDEVLEKTLESKIEWKFDASTNSAQTANLNEFQVHIDRKLIGTKIEYKVWLFDQEMEELDSFHASNLTDYTPDDEKYETYNRLAKAIYDKVRDSATVAAITPAIDKLKNL